MAGNESILDTVRNMVEQGESEEKITETLKQLGVDEEQAKRLQLIIQADAFKLLKNEITEIVRQELRNQVPEHIKALAAEAREQAKVNKEIVLQEIKQKFHKAADTIGFQEEIRANTRAALDASGSAAAKVSDMQKQLDQISSEMEKLRARTTGMKRKKTAILLLLAGIVFVATAIYLVFQHAQDGISTENIALITALSFTGIVSMFLSTRL